MKRLLFILLLSIPFASFGQQHVLFRDSTTIDSFRLTMWVRQLIPPAVPKINPFFDSLGSAYLDSTGAWWRHNGITWQPLTTDPDSAIWATNYYVDSGLASISAGAVDTNNYISSITRLNREIDSVSNIIDSNNTIIYGSLSDLYDTKANKDTLTNFLLKSDTATLSNRINLKQNYSDTTTWDATRYWVSTQIPSLSGYVPYTGATTNVNLGTHTISAYNGVINHVSGSGTALSVTKGGSGEALTVTKSSGSGNAMSVSGGVTQLSELHTTTAIADAYIASAATWNAKGTVNSVATGYGLTGGTITNTGTISADSTELATKALVKKQIDSVAALSGGGTLTSIQLIGGTGVTITPTIAATTVGVFTISATGGGGGSPISATATQVVYKGGSDTLEGADNVVIDSTDGRLVLPNNTDTARVLPYYDGGTKIVGRNRMGMSSLVLVDTVAIPAALQRAINAQTASLMFPVFPSLVYTNNYVYTGMMSTVGTASYVPAAYNSTIQHFNWNKYLLTTASGSNSNALIRTTGITNSAGIICGNTKFSGGGGRGTFTFSFPAYLATERIMIGYVGAGIAAMSTDPSSMLGSNASLLLVKDAADATLFFMHSNTSGAAPTKVNTGIIPNAEDVYRLTVYIAPNSTYYMQLEVLSKTGTKTVVINPTTAIPPVGSRMVSYQAVNNGVVGGIISYGIIQVMEEIY